MSATLHSSQSYERVAKKFYGVPLVKGTTTRPVARGGGGGGGSGGYLTPPPKKKKKKKKNGQIQRDRKIIHA